ncbi:KpsF/GutQ family sugar-phosphate isomerase [Microvirga sp. W0021]|uniref:KpsF/GutQ family sugar-phosphate isomerase n=1 Tax=Hohaiivirga grylli TaxID=3133970 RepID=A0ABV0BJU5_9HYPH
MTKTLTSQERDNAVSSALKSLELERDGIEALRQSIANGLGTGFADAIDTIASASGRVIVTGIGKPGYIARKLTATMASTGTSAYYVHPAEASHGDLGMIRPEDVIIALSWSGESKELADIVAYAKRFRVPLISITSSADSSLGRQSDICLLLPKAPEACPNGLAPTTSTTMELALCDAIAVALLEYRGFTAENFKDFHPGGKLGAQLKRVSDIMHKEDRLPIVTVGTPMADAIRQMSDKSFGCVIITEQDGRLAGVITDGDLRRNLRPDLATTPVEAIMTRNPRGTISPDALLATALELQERIKITAIIVVDEGKPVGLVHYLDLLRIGAA